MSEIDRRNGVRKNWKAGLEFMRQGRSKEGMAAAFSAEPFMTFRDIEWLLEEATDAFEKNVLSGLQQRTPTIETEAAIDAAVVTIALELGDRWNSTSDEKVSDLAKRAAERGDPVAKVFASPDPAGLSRIEAKRLMLKRLLEARAQWPDRDDPRF